MSYKFPVEAGAIMEFARAVGDPNPIYYNQDYAKETEMGGVIASPTFVQSCAHFDPDWSLRPQIGQPWVGSGREPTGDPNPKLRLDKGLHAEMHYEYFGVLRPGDILTVETRLGDSWDKVGKRGGVLHFHEKIYEYFNESGELMVRARWISVVPEKTV